MSPMLCTQLPMLPMELPEPPRGERRRVTAARHPLAAVEEEEEEPAALPVAGNEYHPTLEDGEFPEVRTPGLAT
jgi:hypothetical protein